MEGLTDNVRSTTSRDDCDFYFAFNNCTFSDRILRLEIIMELQEPKLGAEDDGAPQSMVQKAVNMAQESSSNVVSDDLNVIIDVRNIHVNSLLLAKKSLFFHELFSNGMRETIEKEVTVQITSSEEHAFIDLLKFMYCGTLTAMSTKELLDVMILADKFEVMSCIRQCASALLGQPMSNQLASLILSLPWGLLITDAMQPLFKAAKEGLLNNFCDDGQGEQEYTNLSINVIEELLSSDELVVPSEDYIFDFVMKWAKQLYHKEDERREVLRNKLVKLMRFPHMTNSKLSQILSHKDLRCENVLELVSEALLFKAGNSCLTFNSTEERFRKRAYELIPVKVIEFHSPLSMYNVNVYCEFNFHKHQRSESFYMLGKEFSLVSCPNVYGHSWSCGGDVSIEHCKWDLYLETMYDEEFSLEYRYSLWPRTTLGSIKTLDFVKGKKLVLLHHHEEYYGDMGPGFFTDNNLYLTLHVTEVTSY